MLCGQDGAAPRGCREDCQGEKGGIPASVECVDFFQSSHHHLWPIADCCCLECERIMGATANALGVRMLERGRREAEKQAETRSGGLNPEPPKFLNATILNPTKPRSRS